MKTQKKDNKNIFTKIAILVVPVVVLMIIISLALCLFFDNNRHLGLLPVVMPLGATFLAFVGIVLSVISARIDSRKDDSKDKD